MSVGQYSSSEVVAVIALWLAAGAVVGFIRTLIAEKYNARVHWTTVLVDIIFGPYSFIGLIRGVSNMKARIRDAEMKAQQEVLRGVGNWPPPPPPQ